MPSFADQWDAILAEEPEDWENLFCEVRIDDNDRMEEAGLIMCPLNPWHGETWRSGWFRIRVARTFGYGADGQLTANMLRKLDDRRITGSIVVQRSLDQFLPVHTQGTV